MAAVTIDLLRDVTVPQEGSNETELHSAGDTITVSKDEAERCIRIGAATEVKSKKK